MTVVAQPGGKTHADVTVHDVVKAFGDVVAVNHVSFEVQQGEFFSLLGPSGCGKTTTLRMIAGFEQPDQGRIEIGGVDVTGVPAYRRATNMVFQRLALFPHMTVFENVAFGLQVKRVPGAEVERRVRQVLDMVELGDLAQRRPSQLSGGQQQRVALARALVNQPRVLLLDEPLSALDRKLRQQMQLELKRIQREVGTTFVFVTHDQEEAMTMSDRIAVMDHGIVAQLDTPRNIYDRPRSRFVAGFLGNTNLLEGTVRQVAGTGIEVECCGLIFTVRDDEAGIPPPGARIGLSLRHERVVLASERPSANRFRATLTDVIFSGSVVKYFVRLHPEGPELTAEVAYDGNADLYGPGDEVEVSWDPSAMVVLFA
ncbi:MAG TPA: ABC transporter ATP-binding protein [Bacillota bacterium]